MVKPTPSHRLTSQQTVALHGEDLSTNEHSPPQAEPMEPNDEDASGVSDNSSRLVGDSNESFVTTEAEDRANPIIMDSIESAHSGGGGDSPASLTVSSIPELDSPRCRLRPMQQNTEKGTSAEAASACGEGTRREDVNRGVPCSSRSGLQDSRQSHLPQSDTLPEGVDRELAAFNWDLVLQFLTERIQASSVSEPPCLNQWHMSLSEQYNGNSEMCVQVRRSLSEEMVLFERSDQREKVRQKAASVHIESLDSDSFVDLLYGLFQQGGVTRERVLVLFYFLIDLLVRSLLENLTATFECILEWSRLYIVGPFSIWIQGIGGWEVVVDQSINHFYTAAKIGLLCVGIIALCIYIRNNR